MTELTQSGSIVISRSPDEVYDMVADVARTGEWSPVCQECWWDEGDGPRVGARFTGRNVTPERSWETRSEVVAADRGRAFAWVVAEPPTRATWSRSNRAMWSRPKRTTGREKRNADARRSKNPAAPW